MKWYIPPECRGQIVEVAYGDRFDGKGYRRITDRSDGTVKYAVTDLNDCSHTGECDCWETWNSKPLKFKWEKCQKPQEDNDND